MKIKTKLFILCTVLAIIPASVVLILFYEMAEEVTSNIFKDLVSEYNQQLLNSFNNAISEQTNDLNTLVRHIVDKNSDFTTSHVFADLVEFRNREKIFESVEIINDQFIVLNHSSRPYIGEKSTASTQLQKIPSSIEHRVELYRNQELNKTVLRFIVPFKKNKHNYFIVAQIPSDRIKSILALTQKPIGGFINPKITIKSIGGITTFSSANTSDLPNFNAEIKSLSDHESKYLDLENEGHFLFSRLGSWIAISQVYEHEIHLPIHQLRDRLLWGMVLFYIAVFVFIHYLMTFLLRPLHSIIKEMAHTKEGRFKPVTYEGFINDEFYELISVFNNMQSQLQTRIVNLTQTSKLAALGEMAAGIAHEINNPLQVIYGTITAIGTRIKKSNLDESTKTEILKLESRIQTTIQRIAKIIQGLKYYSRDGEKTPARTEQIQKIIETTLDFCQERFRKHDLEVRINLANHSFYIDCIYSQISQIILNLLNNAFDVMTDTNGKWVSIEIREQNENILIEVQNDGPKIQEAIAAKVFQPFFTTKDPSKGTGLGLSVSLGIAHQHGGELFIDNTKEHTCFVLQLPKSQQHKSKTLAA